MYEKKYGKNTVIAMQVGAFFEFYGVDNQTEKIGNLKVLSDLLNIELTRRNKAILENSRTNCLMIGFPIVKMSKFLNILLSNNMTIVVIEQTEQLPKGDFKREVTNVFSPATYLDSVNNAQSNNVISIYINEYTCYKTHTPIFSYGLSSIDLSTGNNLVYQNSVGMIDKNMLLDDIYRFIETNNCREILFHSTDLKNISRTEINGVINITMKQQKK